VRVSLAAITPRRILYPVPSPLFLHRSPSSSYPAIRRDSFHSPKSSSSPFLVFELPSPRQPSCPFLRHAVVRSSLPVSFSSVVFETLTRTSRSTVFETPWNPSYRRLPRAARSVCSCFHLRRKLSRGCRNSSVVTRSIIQSLSFFSRVTVKEGSKIVASNKVYSVPAESTLGTFFKMSLAVADQQSTVRRAPRHH